jgi:hypothetical protein
VFVSKADLPEWSTFQVLHSTEDSWPYMQTFFRLERLARDKSSNLLGVLVNYDCKKIFIKLAPDSKSLPGPSCSLYLSLRLVSYLRIK